jgi:GSH-dependent disulfide-bond oxidoreductase
METAMIDLYFAPTPNGLKARLCLEESGLDYRIVPVRLSAGEQYAPAYLAISPNNKIPAIVDRAPADGAGPLSMFESGAILTYVAQKSGRLLPSDERDRLEAMQWLFWQVSGLGPMGGQAGYFRVYAPQLVPEAIDRYTRELRRLYTVLDRRLAGRDYLAGDDYSIADVACYPWIVPHAAHGQDLGQHLHLARWFERVAARPATQRVYDGVVDVYSKTPALTAAERATLYGQGASDAGAAR